MNKIKLFILSILFSLPSLADRYDLYDPSDEYSSGYSSFSMNGLLATLFVCWLIYISYKSLWESFLEWQKRKENNTKPDLSGSLSDWVGRIVGYIILSLVLIVPILVFIKWTDSKQAMRESYLTLHILAFIVVAFFRKT